MPKVQYPREGIIAFLTFLVLLPMGALFFLTLFGWLVAANFGATFSRLVRMTPRYFEMAIESFNIYIIASIIIFAIYFGLRTAKIHWFSWLEASLVALIVPFISMTIVDMFHSPLQKVLNGIIHKLTADADGTIALLLPTLACILLCRYLLVRVGVLYKDKPTQ